MTAGQIQKRLLHWFGRHARVLPWRSAAARRDPYRVWISEIMLQQTQVATVIPYYRRWLRLFPTVRALAAAKPAAVLKAWEGLGYYLRARHLHAAARALVRRHDGRLPANREALLALPGVGRYTAGAILSIAFGQPEPLVDGNVARVLARPFGIRHNVKSARGQRRLWKLAGELMRAGRAPKFVPRRRPPHPGRFNESLMELGATVCVPQNPRCGMCPLRALCVARRRGVTALLPNTGVRPKSRLIRQRALLIWRDGRVLVRRRPGGGRMGGFWEFPGRRPVGVQCVAVRRIAAVRHGVMNDRIRVEAFDCWWLSGSPVRQGGGQQWRWVRPAGLRRLLFVGAHRKIVALHPRGVAFGAAKTLR